MLTAREIGEGFFKAAGVVGDGEPGGGPFTVISDVRSTVVRVLRSWEGCCAMYRADRWMRSGLCKGSAKLRLRFRVHLLLRQ